MNANQIARVLVAALNQVNVPEASVQPAVVEQPRIKIRRTMLLPLEVKERLDAVASGTTEFVRSAAVKQSVRKRFHTLVSSYLQSTHGAGTFRVNKVRGGVLATRLK